jgi:hypothetical protein
MFGFLKKPAKPDFSELRELLFGDVPLSDWKPRDGAPQPGAPWSGFEMARSAKASGDSAGCVAALRSVLVTPNLETRHCLQAWHFLRQLGIRPETGDAKRVLGVVLEVHLKAGLDTLAAYADGGARYINHGGHLVVWEAVDSTISKLIDDLLSEAQRVADMIGPWEEPRRGPPPKGHVRLNMLTASGLHFGEGPFASLSEDPMRGPLIAAGTRLMTALISRAEAKPA